MLTKIVCWSKELYCVSLYYAITYQKYGRPHPFPPPGIEPTHKTVGHSPCANIKFNKAGPGLYPRHGIPMEGSQPARAHQGKVHSTHCHTLMYASPLEHQCVARLPNAWYANACLSLKSYINYINKQNPLTIRKSEKIVSGVALLRQSLLGII